jgi:hypothetical protein
MWRLGAAAFVLATLAGCSSGRHATPRPGCLADWNGQANAAARATATPPLGPYPLYGAGPPLSPRGTFDAFVGRSPVIGAIGTNPPPVCYVWFRFPHGYRGGPALVSYLEISPRKRLYGEPSITTGKNTDVGGRIYLQGRDGRLHPTNRMRRT